MNLQDLRTLLDYHYWARDRLLDAVAPLPADEFNRDRGSSFTSIRETVVHIYAAEWAWHQRWIGTSPAALLTSERFPDVESVRTAWTELEGNVRGFVDGLGDAGVTKVFSYKLLSGLDGSTPLGEMIQHVVNHASYHRGQVTTMLRQAGAQPAKSMDMIAFFRSRG
jgi:uncharacterized damage-inducible protein DinB